jgi:ATP-dependent exoDNAse (exonuclease V) beta subunit
MRSRAAVRAANRASRYGENKGKWQAAAAEAGFGKARGEQLSAVAKALYVACGDAYKSFTANIAGAALARFVDEFTGLRDLYADYKRQAALLDFDDLLHHARDLLIRNAGVRQALARRYPRILVDEFQDTDPLQAEILWLLCGEGDESEPWTARRLRPGSLFLVGDPKQAIYRFRGADVDTYLAAKRALLAQDPGSILEITANFRSRAPILEFANSRFQPLLSEAAGQPGFTPLAATRAASSTGPAIACFEIPIDDSHKDDNGKLNGDLVREHEAAIVAEIVQRLIGHYEIWDKRTQTMRICRAGDIALLAPPAPVSGAMSARLNTVVCRSLHRPARASSPGSDRSLACYRRPARHTGLRRSPSGSVGRLERRGNCGRHRGFAGPAKRAPPAASSLD